jgi:hypothetical protein
MKALIHAEERLNAAQEDIERFSVGLKRPKYRIGKYELTSVQKK